MFVWVIEMIQYDRIDDSKKIDLDKTDKSKECEVCRRIYSNNGFKSDSKVRNSCNWRIESFGNFAIITVNDVDCIIVMFDMTEDDVIDVIKDFEPNELLKCYSMKKLMFQKELTLIKEVHQKKV